MHATNASAKRTFLHMAFHPDGDYVCREIGLAPSSLDVAHAEDRSAVERLKEFMRTTDFDTVATLASWYHDGVAAVDHPSMVRTDVEHLLSFYAAAHTFVKGERNAKHG